MSRYFQESIESAGEPVRGIHYSDRICLSKQSIALNNRFYIHK
jgi:hypothetical protein